MTIENPQLVTILIFIQGALVIAQAALLALATSSLMRSARQVEKTADLISQRSAQTRDQASRLLAVIEQISGRLPDLGQSVEEKLETIVDLSQRADRVLAHQLSSLRGRMEKFRAGADGLMSTFSEQTFRVHRAVLDPSMRLSAILQAGIATARRIVSRGNGSPSAHLPDEEIFI